MIASYMDDDDRIVYGWDFLVTQQEQQEQEQQDKRVLGVRIRTIKMLLMSALSIDGIDI